MARRLKPPSPQQSSVGLGPWGGALTMVMSWPTTAVLQACESQGWVHQGSHPGILQRARSGHLSGICSSPRKLLPCAVGYSEVAAALQLFLLLRIGHSLRALACFPCPALLNWHATLHVSLPQKHSGSCPVPLIVEERLSIRFISQNMSLRTRFSLPNAGDEFMFVFDTNENLRISCSQTFYYLQA